MKGPGLQMRNMPYDVCTNPKYDQSSTQSSMEHESGRKQVEVSELSERTNTIENQSSTSSSAS